MTPVDVPIDAIRAAHRVLPPEVVRTPLIPLPHDGSGPAVHLKLETLGPIGSFKLRGAGNALAGADLTSGVWTASAGNMAQAVAWMARAQGVACSVVVPDHAPDAKLRAIARFGADVIRVPFERWWEVIVSHTFDGLDGRFVHPVCDPAVIAGNGTVGLEILDQCPDVAAVVVPYGGGGLSSGIAAALRAEAPHVQVFAAEVTTAAPLAAAFVAGGPVDVDHQPSFVDGIGSGRVLDEMWPLVSSLLEGSIVVGLDEVAAALRLVVQRARVVAEGAGAAAVAAALRGELDGPVVAVVSGGNIDADVLAEVLAGRTPA
ncbi:MAG: pyridoxal-phosphate dependent enzyme [Actinomycetota bacterium]